MGHIPYKTGGYRGRERREEFNLLKEKYGTLQLLRLRKESATISDVIEQVEHLRDLNAQWKITCRQKTIFPSKRKNQGDLLKGLLRGAERPMNEDNLRNKNFEVLCPQLFLLADLLTLNNWIGQILRILQEYILLKSENVSTSGRDPLTDSEEEFMIIESELSGDFENFHCRLGSGIKIRKTISRIDNEGGSIGTRGSH